MKGSLGGRREGVGGGGHPQPSKSPFVFFKNAPTHQNLSFDLKKNAPTIKNQFGFQKKSHTLKMGFDFKKHLQLSIRLVLIGVLSLEDVEKGNTVP